MTDHIFRFFLDNVQYESPIGWDKWEERIERNQENGLLMLSNVQLEFYGEAYQYLKKKFDRDRRGQVAFRLADNHSKLGDYSGTIFLTDVDWDITFCKAKTPIQDDSFFARINNNKSVKFTVSAGIAKNKKEIPVATPYMLDVMKVSDNTLLRTIYSVRIYEAFRYAIEFMSDGLMEFRSDTFGLNGSCAGWCITTGLKLSSTDPDVYSQAGDSPIPEFNFTDLLTNISKQIEVGYRIEKEGSKTIFRLESLDRLFSSSRMATMSNLPGIRLSTIREKLYAKVKVGSSTVNNDPSLSFPEDITLYGFKDEEFPLLGTANIDATLDLVKTWIVSSNCIEFATVSGSYDNDYDSDIFLIDSTPVSEYAGATVNTNFLQQVSPKYYYNETFTNLKTLDRFLQSLPGDLFKQIFPDDGGNTFEARRSADVFYSITSPQGFQAIYANEISDPDSNYTPSIYTAKYGGLYTFIANQEITINAKSPSVVVYWQLQLVHMDAAGVEINRYDLFVPNHIGPTGVGYYSYAFLGSFTLGGQSIQLNMTAGDKVKVVMYVSPVLGGIDYGIYTPSLFACTEAITQGAAYLKNDALQFKALRYTVEASLPRDQFDKVRRMQSGTILINDAFGNQGEGWIENLTYNNLNSRIKLNLLTNIQLS